MNKVLGSVVGLGLTVAGLAVLAMTVVGTSDIVAMWFKVPIPGAYELIALLMVLVIFLALPEVEFSRKHIAIDMLSERASPPIRHVFAVIGNVLSLLFYAAMAWQAWRLFWGSWSIREYATGLVAFPVYPAKALFALGVTVVAVAACANLLRTMTSREAATLPVKNVPVTEKDML